MYFILLVVGAFLWFKYKKEIKEWNIQKFQPFIKEVKQFIRKWVRDNIK